MEQFAHRSCGSSIPGSVQRQAGLGSEQPGLMEGVPAHGRGAGTSMKFKFHSNPNYSVIPGSNEYQLQDKDLFSRIENSFY